MLKSTAYITQIGYLQVYLYVLLWCHKCWMLLKYNITRNNYSSHFWLLQWLLHKIKGVLWPWIKFLGLGWKSFWNPDLDLILSFLYPILLRLNKRLQWSILCAMALSQVSLFNVKVICKPLSKIFVLTLFSELLALFAIYFAHGVLVRERIAGRFSLICESTRHLHVMNHITFTKQFLNWIWIKKTFVMVMLYSLTNLLWHI